MPTKSRFKEAHQLYDKVYQIYLANLNNNNLNNNKINNDNSNSNSLVSNNNNNVNPVAGPFSRNISSSPNHPRSLPLPSSQLVSSVRACVRVLVLCVFKAKHCMG